MDLKKVYRIGIDFWVLRNIKVEYPPHLKRITPTANGDLREGIFEQDKGFIFYSYTKLTKDNELLPLTTVLQLNPNKLLDGHNIFNSRAGRTKEALSYVKELLQKKEIILDYSEAIVDTAEIQINFNRSFTGIERVIDLIFSVMSNGKSKKTSGDSKERHILARRKAESYWWKYKDNTYRAYDKKKEILEVENIDFREKITRLEYKPSNYHFKRFFLENDLDNKLETVLDNFYIIEKEFKKVWLHELKETFQYLEKRYSKELERVYLGFKDAQASARKRGITPERGIYKYIKKNFEVYDLEYINKILEKHEKKNLGREKKLAAQYFDKNKSLEIVNYLLSFFSSLNSDNEEKNKS